MARGYRSDRRDLQAAGTRQAILDAAGELFAVKGWVATGMREVAVAAGVALETVYSHFSNKRGLLRGVIDAAAAGDHDPVPIAERDGFLAIGKGPRAARVRAAARFATEVHVRTAAVAVLLRQAAPADAAVAEMLQATRERQRLDVARAIELLAGRAPTDDERDGVWAVVSPEVYLLLVAESGWSVDRYEEWLVAQLDRMVRP